MTDEQILFYFKQAAMCDREASKAESEAERRHYLLGRDAWITLGRSVAMRFCRPVGSQSKHRGHA